jgi:hypothetical protein
MCYNNRGGDPVKAHVTIRRLNPYSEVTDKVVEIIANGDEETILNFDMDDRGNISNTNDTYTPLFSVVRP